MLNDPCPCGSKRPMADCCDRYVSGHVMPATAEALMRSRYTAFVTANADYLRATWHPDTRPSRVRFDDKQRWLGLQIRACEAGQEDHDEGFVEFVARYKIDGRGHRLHERSRFLKDDGRWYYLNGEHFSQALGQTKT